MAIEAIAALATKEVAAIKTAETVRQQLIQKIADGSVEQAQISQSIEHTYSTHNFRVGEVSSPEIENKEIYKQRESEFADELKAKMDSAEMEVPFRDTGEDCLTSYEERYQQTSRDGWEGQRGESWCEKEINGKNERVLYNNSIPDFTPFSKANVEIPNMSGERYGEGGNFEQADSALADQWNQAYKDFRHDWTASEVRDRRRENLSDYTWHECTDRKTCQLIPRDINASFGHLGGVGECNKRACIEAFSPSREGNSITKALNSSFNFD